MDTTCYFDCFLNQGGLGAIGIAGILSVLLFLFYKKSGSHTLRLISLYLILGILPFTVIYFSLNITCSHGFCVGDFFEFISIAIMGSVGFLSVVYYFFGSRIYLNAIGGEFLNEGDAPELNKIFKSLCDEIGVKAKLAYINSGKTKAMSVSGSENVVLISVGALEILDEKDDEIKAVLAHELAHLKLQDPMIKFISKIFGLSYVYNFISNKVELEQEKRANEIAEKFSSKIALKNAISKFSIKA